MAIPMTQHVGHCRNSKVTLSKITSQRQDLEISLLLSIHMFEIEVCWSASNRFNIHCKMFLAFARFDKGWYYMIRNSSETVRNLSMVRETKQHIKNMRGEFL